MVRMGGEVCSSLFVIAFTRMAVFLPLPSFVHTLNPTLVFWYLAVLLTLSMYTSIASSVIDAPLTGWYPGFVVFISGFVNIRKIFDMLCCSVVVGSNVMARPPALVRSFLLILSFVNVSLSLGCFDFRFYFVCSCFSIRLAAHAHLLGLSHRRTVLSVWHGPHVQFFDCLWSGNNVCWRCFMIFRSSPTFLMLCWSRRHLPDVELFSVLRVFFASMWYHIRSSFSILLLSLMALQFSLYFFATLNILLISSGRLTCS